MLRALRRQVRLRAPPSSLFSCTGASPHDLHLPISQHPDTFASTGSLLNTPSVANDMRFMPQWMRRSTHLPNASFAVSSLRAVWTVNMSFGGNVAYSTAAKKEEEDASAETENVKPASQKTLDDFQHEEIVGPTVERDMSPVADELRQAHMEMREAIQKFTKGLLAVGVVHLVWGGMMFRVLESPFSHALMTQVCASALVLFGLAYYSKQTLKPIDFFTKLEERSRLRILTLSLQVTKTMSSFFQRGYGVGLVLLLALIANFLGCLKFLF